MLGGPARVTLVSLPENYCATMVEIICDLCLTIFYKNALEVLTNGKGLKWGVAVRLRTATRTLKGYFFQF